MARRIVTSRPAKTIDYKQWDSMPTVQIAGAAAATHQGGAITFNVPATILRCRGELLMYFDATKQVGDLMIVTAALGIVSADAYTAGVGSMPDPAGEPEYPWLWWGEWRLDSIVAAAEEGAGLTVHRVSVDTKAMRKIKPGQNIAWIFELGGVVGAPATIIEQTQTRVLIGT